MIADGLFRSDLYYRLNVFPMASLRCARPDDIPSLVHHFVCINSPVRWKRRITIIPSAAMEALKRRHWPATFRELENLIERAVILSSGPELRCRSPISDPR